MKYYQRLRDLREDADKKQEEIAIYLGITRPQYQLYESGKREIPLHHFIALAKYYNVSLDYLAGILTTPKPLHNSADLTAKQLQLVKKYADHPDLQKAVDKLLDIT